MRKGNGKREEGNKARKKSLLSSPLRDKKKEKKRKEKGKEKERDRERKRRKQLKQKLLKAGIFMPIFIFIIFLRVRIPSFLDKYKYIFDKFIHRLFESICIDIPSAFSV